MAQFDVHRNPGRTRAAIPFVLVVQSDRWGDRPDRVVVPLVLSSEVRYRDATLNPEFIIDGTAVGNLDRDHIQVIAALDALIAQGR